MTEHEQDLECNERSECNDKSKRVSMAAAAAAAAAKALPYIEMAAVSIGKVIDSAKEKREQIKKVEARIDALLTKIKANEKWFTDQGRQLPKLGGNASLIGLVEKVVKDIVGVIQDRKLKKRTEEATQLDAYNAYLEDEKKKQVGGAYPFPVIAQEYPHGFRTGYDVGGRNEMRWVDRSDLSAYPAGGEWVSHLVPVAVHLAKSHAHNPRTVRRFMPIVNGSGVANPNFSPLRDDQWFYDGTYRAV